MHLFFVTGADNHRDLPLSIRRQRQICIRDRLLVRAMASIPPPHSYTLLIPVLGIVREPTVWVSLLPFSEPTQQAKNSYAVFFVKKKKTITTTHNVHHHN